MMVSPKVMREAREAVIAFRFHGALPPANPYHRETRSHLYWEMGVRKAESTVADLMRIGK